MKKKCSIKQKTANSVKGAVSGQLQPLVSNNVNGADYIIFVREWVVNFETERNSPFDTCSYNSNIK